LETAVALVLFPSLAFLILHLCVLSQPLEQRPWLLRLLVASVVLRMAAVTAFEEIPELRLYHADSYVNEHFGALLSESWHGGAPPLEYPDEQRNVGFHFVCAGIYFLFGTYVPNVAYVNAIISTLTVFLTYQLTRRFFHYRIARLASLLTAFSPSMLLYGSMAVKEPTVLLLLLVAISSAVALTRGLNLVRITGVIVPMLLLQPIRFYVVYFVAFAIVGSFALGHRSGSATKLVKTLAVGLMILLAFLISGLARRAGDGLDVFTLEQLSGMRESAATSGNSGYDAGTDVSTPGRAVAFLPFGILTLLLGPLPWQFRTAQQLIAAPEVVAWWYLFPSVLRGIRFATRRCARATSPILLFCASLTIAYGLGQGEMGTAVRQRGQIFVFLFMFAALGRYQLRCRRAGISEELLIKDPDGGFGDRELALAPLDPAFARVDAFQPPASPDSLDPRGPFGKVAHCQVCQGRRVMAVQSGPKTSYRPCIVCRGRGWMVFHASGSGALDSGALDRAIDAANPRGEASATPIAESRQPP
jgi:hypothetical protein